jgi:hypothetical protein
MHTLCNILTPSDVENPSLNIYFEEASLEHVELGVYNNIRCLSNYDLWVGAALTFARRQNMGLYNQIKSIYSWIVTQIINGDMVPEWVDRGGRVGAVCRQRRCHLPLLWVFFFFFLSLCVFKKGSFFKLFLELGHKARNKSIPLFFLLPACIFKAVFICLKLNYHFLLPVGSDLKKKNSIVT